MQINRGDIIQFIKFGMVGVSNTIISLAIYYVFLWVDPSLYLIGNIVAGIVSVANSFLWNHCFVFTDTYEGIQDIVKKIIKTYVSYGGTFLLSTVLLYVEVDVLKLSAVVCPIVNLIVTIPLNFLLNKFWTFRKKQ